VGACVVGAVVGALLGVLFVQLVTPQAVSMVEQLGSGQEYFDESSYTQQNVVRDRVYTKSSMDLAIISNICQGAEGLWDHAADACPAKSPE
jgi:hypothetical protein